MDWNEEWQKIRAACFRYGVDPYFIGSVRKVENGAAGREFGVLAVSAPTYDDQLRVCIASVKHRLVEYGANHPVLSRYTAPNGDAIVIYHPDFINWFSSIWAPVGAENDPNSLNRNWARNASWWYIHLLDADHQMP